MGKIKNILITGISGYIGSNLKAYFDARGYLANGLDVNPKEGHDICGCDITDYISVCETIQQLQPDIIIHAAGLSNLSLCEKDPLLAKKVNTRGTDNIAKAVSEQSLKCKLIFLSTDYVFDGKTGDYKETDNPIPVTVYGQTKLEAEKGIKDVLSDYAICRTANVYGRGGNFLKFVFSSLKSEQKIEVFNDAFFTPTYVDDLANMIELVIEKDIKGLMHTAGPEKVNRFAFARKIAKVFNFDEKLIIPAAKPAESFIADDVSLNTDNTKKNLNINPCNIEEGLLKAGGI